MVLGVPQHAPGPARGPLVPEPAPLAWGVIEAAGGGLAFLLRPWAQAITLGHVILARSPRSLAALRAHERRHVRQYERLGPFFLPAYFLIGAVIWLRGGRPYLDHPLERQAGLREPRE
jgi:hypothetical protein